ncbi:MAG TPA: peptidoglycan-binding protein LysM [Candidatus Binataceae bacterium]|nr:peptidoglycan-binding protein LysM [Candidatus Binataceae bacterium]
MGLVSFIKEAGAFLFGQSAGNPAPANSASELSVDVLQKQAAAIGVAVDNLAITLNDGTATVHGSVRSQADREKLILAIGNTPGVGQVDDQLTINASPAAGSEAPAKSTEPAATLYTVRKGDTLSAIAKTYYKDASKYPRIFEANRPMLGDPNKIYPGQVLRIPPET